VKNSIRGLLFSRSGVVRILPGAAPKKKPGRWRPGSDPSPARQPADGRFIWQLVGVLET
jgi:hypothetical protein